MWAPHTCPRISAPLYWTQKLLFQRSISLTSSALATWPRRTAPATETRADLFSCSTRGDYCFKRTLLEHWTFEHWTLEHWTLEHWTLEHWTLEHWTLEHWTLNIRTLNIGTLNIGTLNIRTLNIEHWTLNIEHWTLEHWTLNIRTLNIRTLEH
jgi:hypothetical protein